MPKSAAIFSIVALILLAAAPVLADVVFLKNGTVHEGVIKSMTKDSLDLETPSGTLHVSASMLDNSSVPNGIMHMKRIPIVKVLQIKFKRHDNERAKKVLEKLEAEGDFEKLAGIFSTDESSGGSGGNIGYIRVGETLPEIDNTVFRMKIGETSGIVQSNEALHILRVADIRYQDRDTREYYDADGKKLPLQKITVRIYQVKNVGRNARDIKADESVYNSLKAALQKYEAVTLDEMPGTEPEKEDSDNMAAEKFDFQITADVSVKGDIVRISYRVSIPFSQQKHKADTGTFQGVDTIENVATGFAADIYNSLPKNVDQEKLDREKEAAQKEKSEKNKTKK